MEDKKVIMYDSPEAAKPHTMQGWLSSDGFFFKDEGSARYKGCTHRPCTECGKPAERMYTSCDECRYKHKKERYDAKEFKEWDGETPLYSETFSEYYFDEDDIITAIDDFMEENDGAQPNMMLVICQPNNYRFVNADYWGDVLPEEGEVDEILIKKMDELNEFIKTLPPASWRPGKIRTEYNPE